MTIRAGRIEEAVHTSGDWVFVDVGFSNKEKSYGFLCDDGQPEELTFSEARARLVHLVQSGTQPLNLVLEAPLSVAFDSLENPVGRKIEKRDGIARYWYVPLGCGVMVPATYLLRAITDSTRTREVRLFEGLVSFKPKGVASNHCDDVQRLRDIVWGVVGSGRVVASNELTSDSSHTLRSAFAVSGMDYGIPPVVSVGAI